MTELGWPEVCLEGQEQEKKKWALLFGWGLLFSLYSHFMGKEKVWEEVFR